MTDLINKFKTDNTQRSETASEIVKELGEENALNLAECILAELGGQHKVVWTTYSQEHLSCCLGRLLDENDMEECQAHLDDFNPIEYL